jgi:predicted TIM-barrel fold metal-dependent hydrolase
LTRVSGIGDGDVMPSPSDVGLIDCDMHFFESADTWSSYADPHDRDRALGMAPDELGYLWLTHRDRPIRLAEPHHPGDVDRMGAYRQRRRDGLPPDVDYLEQCADYADVKARLAHLDRTGFEAAVLFPNYGLLWERELGSDLPSVHANMTAWNRYAADVHAEGGGRLHPVGHLSLRDPDWVRAQLQHLAAAGIRLAFIAPATVNGLRLSAPELDHIWAAFVDHGISPVFHVADQPRVFDDAWFTDEDDATVSVLQSVFLWTPVALAVTDLILGGVLERHPDLRIGIMELSAPWVPLHLMMMDGGLNFASRFEGADLADLPLRPSEYFRRQVRVAAFSYERPDRLTRHAGDIFMACSDYPHAEGTTTPMEDYATTAQLTPGDAPELFGGNVGWLLRKPVGTR